MSRGVLHAAALASAATLVLVAGSYVTEEKSETCVLCGASRRRTTWRFAGLPIVTTGGVVGTRASEVYRKLVSHECGHLWGGGKVKILGHLVFVPLGAKESTAAGPFPAYRHTARVMLALSRLDDPEAAPELYRYLVPGKPDEGRVGPEFVDQLERCICRFYVLFPGGEVPEVVEAKRFREVKSSGRCP